MLGGPVPGIIQCNPEPQTIAFGVNEDLVAPRNVYELAGVTAIRQPGSRLETKARIFCASLLASYACGSGLHRTHEAICVWLLTPEKTLLNWYTLWSKTLVQFMS